MIVEQQFPVDQQVVEVHGIGLAFAILVAAEDGDHLLLVDREMGKVFLQVQFQRRARVDQIRIDVQEHVALGEALLEGFDAEGGDSAVHGLFGIFVVEDREIRAISDGVGVVAEQAIADRVKRAAPDAARVDGNELLDAAEHLPRRLVGKRQEEDLRGVDAVFDQPRDAVGEGARLPAASAGDDQHRPVAGHHHLELLAVELLAVLDAILLRRLRGSFQSVTADLGHEALFSPKRVNG